jgi:hypothetical protein
MAAAAVKSVKFNFFIAVYLKVYVDIPSLFNYRFILSSLFPFQVARCLIIGANVA